jgi:monoamine oxidase
MARFKFTLARAAVIEEYYEIEADSEEEAMNIAYDGNYGEPVRTEFVDWRDDEWTAVDCEETCKLYKMIKEHECGTS